MLCMCELLHRADHFDFEVLSNGLFEEWKKCEHLNGDASNLNRTRAEMEAIFIRVGLQKPVASKVADEIYAKLGFESDQSISFNDFLSLIHSDSERMRQSTINEKTESEKQRDDVYVVSPSANARLIDDSNDLHAHSGLSN